MMILDDDYFNDYTEEQKVYLQKCMENGSRVIEELKEYRERLDPLLNDMLKNGARHY
jgi:Mg2+ and Co2+ transporter CorA